jgi:ribulose-phosphate 3-epimerase
MLAGCAISPETPSSAITAAIGSAADLLLVMTVRPGRGGQKFMPECLDKVADLRARFPGKNIQVDGGVGAGNACQCARAGSNVLVAGTAIFGSADPRATIKEMREGVDGEFAARAEKEGE